ncbi:hypothetical protein YTPLAS18_24340 [Nitrospira sp.]|nr:hypothetical protein YTPLAS18_24340 [Nitrospira sp.]
MWLVPVLFGAEALVVGILLMAYRAEGKSDWTTFLASRPGLLCIAGVVVLLVAIAFVVHQCRVSQRNGSRQWIFAIILNAAVVMGIVGVGEFALRLLAVSSNTEDRIAGRLLYPRQWDITAANFRAILKRSEAQAPFWIYDSDLGWTIGPSRQDSSGLYRSSAEGLRSTTVGEVLEKESPGCRIAFVGDSFTFGEEVAAENAWVHLLGQELGPDCQVLNFAVGGYGVDQMYLRYLRDIRPWKPDLVVLAFVNHDVVRSLSIYSFLLFSGGETPFAKPRFVVRGGRLEQLNTPLIGPQALFNAPSIRTLPFIEYDGEYRDSEWGRADWKPFYSSYLFRLLLSLYPLHEPERPEISAQALREVNTELFRAFQKAVATTGANSLIVYLPSVDEVPERLPWVPIGQAILRDGNIPHVDLRDCMADGYTPDMFMPVGHGQHYAPSGNRVVVECLRGSIQDSLKQRSSRQN